MDGRIGHLRCRIHRARSGGPALPSLERLARGRLASALGDALDEVAVADGSVQVVRRVHVAFALTAVPDDAALCRQWAERLAAAIARALAQPEGEDLVRFADQAEFVARFADALVSGSAWEQWYFGAFAPLQRHGTGGALRQVLLEHRDQLPAILAWLERTGALERVLEALDEATTRQLLTRAPNTDAIEPLLATATRLLGRLGRLDVARVDRAALLGRYLQRGPAAVSWRDRRALAEGVLEAVRFLVAEGLVRAAPVGAAALGEILSELDWLDTAWLGERLDETLAGDERTAVPAWPARRDSLTPLQRRVLAELAAVLGDGPRRLGGAALDAPSNVLRLTAAVAARGLAGVDPDALTGVITRVLRAARVLSGPPGVHAGRLLARGDRAGAEAALAAAGATPLEVLLLAELGRPVAVLAAAAAAPLEVLRPAGLDRPAAVLSPATPAAASPAEPVPVPWAGALLLTRAALDLRLPALCEATGYPEQGGFPALLAALCVHWGAEAEDPALALIAGEPVPDLTGEADAFEQALARVLAAHGLAVATGESPLERTAGAVLRAWARWLPGFAGASETFLLRRLVGRDGAIRRADDVLHVQIAPRPLDVVLELAGYFDPIDATRALGCRIAYEVVSVP